MLNLIAILIGVVILLVTLFILGFVSFRFALSYFLGENITVTVMDEFGHKRSRRFNCSRDEELVKVIDELKQQTRRQRKMRAAQ